MLDGITEDENPVVLTLTVTEDSTDAVLLLWELALTLELLDGVVEDEKLVEDAVVLL